MFCAVKSLNKDKLDNQYSSVVLVKIMSVARLPNKVPHNILKFDYVYRFTITIVMVGIFRAPGVKLTKY